MTSTGQPNSDPAEREYDWGEDRRLWASHDGRWEPSPSGIFGPLEEGETDPRFECCAADGGLIKDSRPSGADRIRAERKRQQEREGYNPSHDDHHTSGQIAWAAACYAAPAPIYCQSWTYRRPNAPDRSGRAVMEPSSPWATEVVFREPWPWDYSAYKPFEDQGEDEAENTRLRIRELVKAGALIAAEIDRLQRSLDEGDR